VRHRKLYIGVRDCENPKNLIGKRGSDCVDFSEIKHDGLEEFDSREDSLGLGPGDQFVISILRQLHGDNGFGESEVISRDEPVEDPC
jgi:hypothetical protein